MRRDGAFRALLVLLVSTASAAGVPPPENVHVSCQNAAVTLNWNYPEHQPKTRFRVLVSSSKDKILDSETDDHHYDLTHSVWNTQKYYLEYLIANVTALQGKNPSENVQSNSFSFNYLKVVATNCYLDFPPVEIYVNADTEKATVSFVNPILTYKEVNRALSGQSGPKLSFKVSHICNGTEHFGDRSSTCNTSNRICKINVPVPKDGKLCVKLNGELFDNYKGGVVKFRETNETLASDSHESPEVTLAVILTVVVFFLIIMSVIVICKVEACTMKTPQLPSPLIPFKQKPEDQRLTYSPVKKEDISKVSIVQPSKSLSTISDNSNQSQSHRDRSAGLNPDYSGGALSTRRHLSESSSQTNSDSADCSVKTECVSVDSDKEETALLSPYDCPHVHMLDMGDGEIVTGYGGN